MSDEEKLTISVVEAARLLGIDKTSAYKAAHNGSLPAIRLGGRLLVPVAALNEMLENGAPTSVAPSGVLRRFSEEEDRVIREDWASYVRVQDIADKLHRDYGTLRQRIFYLGLRRDGRVVKALKWAPEHMRACVGDMAPDEWIEACYRWREERQQEAKSTDAEAAARDRAEVQALAAEIDAQDDLSRNEKMIAKRMLGLTLEEIAAPLGITRERVRQLTDPNYRVAPPVTHRPDFAEQRLDRLQQRHARERERIIKDAAGRVFAMWERLPDEAKALFAQMQDKAVKVSE